MRQSRLRRALKWGLVALLALMLLLISALVALRLILTDRRTTELVRAQLQERVPAQVELEHLSLHLLSGLEIRNLRIGPPEGFHKDILRLGLLRVRWSAMKLLAGELLIEEMTLTDVYGCLEEQPTLGTNIDVLITALVGPSEEAPPPEPTSDEPLDLASIEVPWPVEVSQLRFERLAFELDQPHQSAHLRDLGVTAQLAAQGRSIRLELELSLGSPEAPANLQLTLVGEPATSVTLTPHLRLGVRTQGLADLAATLELDTVAAVTQGTPLPEVRLRTHLAAQGDLLGQRAEVQSLAIRVGDSTELTASAAAKGFLGPADDIELRLRGLDLRADLAELSPLGAVFVPGLLAQGTLNLHVDPIAASVRDLSAPQALQATLALGLRNIGVTLPEVRVAGVAGDMNVTLTNEEVGAKLSLAAAGIHVAQQSLQGLNLDLDAKTPVAPWLTADTTQNPILNVNLALALARGAGDPWEARTTKVRLAGTVPVGLVLHGSAPVPAKVDLGLAVSRTRGGPATVDDVDLGLQASAFDLRGERADATLRLALGDVLLALPGEEAPFPAGALTLNLDAGTRGKRVELRTLALKGNRGVHLTAQGAVVAPAGPAPTLHDVRLELHPLDLGPLLAALPPTLRPPLELTGSIGLRVRADGRVEHQQLLAELSPPAVQFNDDPAVQRRGIMQIVNYVERVADRFEEGLPCEAEVHLAARDVALAHSSVALSGANLDLGVVLSKKGPAVVSTVALKELRHPEVINEFEGLLDLRFHDRTLSIRSQQTVGWVHPRDVLLEPLENLSTRLNLAYRVGGDMVLEELLLRAPDRPLEVSAAGMIIKPVRVFLENGWQKPGLPGVEAELDLNTSFESRTLAPLAHGAPSMLGKVGFRSHLGVRDGIATLAGALGLDGFNLELESPPSEPEEGTSVTRIDNLTGDLPFEIALAFKSIPEAVPLGLIALPFGGGVLGLITAQSDIRDKPARPVHFERLLPYQGRRGLKADRVLLGRRTPSGTIVPSFEVGDLELYARLIDGIVAADRIALHVLGGDVQGELALQLSRRNQIASKLNMKVSNIDASNIPGMDVEPGAQSELSADFDLTALFGANERDLGLTTNITKIGSQSFDRILQALSSGKEDDPMENVRSSLGLITLNQVAVWMRYESINMDIDFNALIPGYSPIGREDIRRISVSEQLDVYLQPHIDRLGREVLGWQKSDFEG